MTLKFYLSLLAMCFSSALPQSCMATPKNIFSKRSYFNVNNKFPLGGSWVKLHVELPDSVKKEARHIFDKLLADSDSNSDHHSFGPHGVEVARGEPVDDPHVTLVLYENEDNPIQVDKVGTPSRKVLSWLMEFWAFTKLHRCYPVEPADPCAERYPFQEAQLTLSTTPLNIFNSYIFSSSLDRGYHEKSFNMNGDLFKVTSQVQLDGSAGKAVPVDRITLPLEYARLFSSEDETLSQPLISAFPRSMDRLDESSAEDRSLKGRHITHVLRQVEPISFQDLKENYPYLIYPEMEANYAKCLRKDEVAFYISDVIPQDLASLFNNLDYPYEIELNTEDYFLHFRDSGDDKARSQLLIQMRLTAKSLDKLISYLKKEFGIAINSQAMHVTVGSFVANESVVSPQAYKDLYKKAIPFGDRKQI